MAIAHWESSCLEDGNLYGPSRELLLTCTPYVRVQEDSPIEGLPLRVIIIAFFLILHEENIRQQSSLKY